MQKPLLHRVVITVCKSEGLWAAEEGGVFFGASIEKDVAKASANKRAREHMQQGQACQIRVCGEHGFAI